MSTRPMWPVPGSVGLPPDTPLRMQWSGTGTPRIRIAGADGHPESWIRAGTDGYARRTVGAALDDRGLPHLFRYRPFEFDAAGDIVTVRPPHPLTPGRWYRVEVDGMLLDWTFRTRNPLPAGQTLLPVAADGSAPFCTVQGAIDAAEAGADRVLIDVAAGRYSEICYLGEHLPPVTIRGAGRDRTVISYDNNNLLNGRPSDSRCRLRRLGNRDLHNGWRANIGVDAPDVTFQDLTMINTTPLGGSQAEAFRGNHERLLLDRVNVHSYQDTMRLQGQAFVTNSLISGTVDFVWGTGTAYHWRNEYRSRVAAPEHATKEGYVFQIRNGDGDRGHVLHDCRFTREPGVADASVRIARNDATAFPYSEVILIDCGLDQHIDRSAFLITPEPRSTVRFAEHGCVDHQGHRSPLATGPGVRRLTAAEVDRDRDPANVLDGWVPYTVNPTCRAVEPGQLVPIQWSAPAGHSSSDAIDLGGVRTPVDTDATLGSLAVKAPSTPGLHPIRFGDRISAIEVVER